MLLLLYLKLQTGGLGEENCSESFRDDEHRKSSLIRLEVEKLKILEEDLARKKEKIRRELEAVSN